MCCSLLPFPVILVLFLLNRFSHEILVTTLPLLYWFASPAREYWLSFKKKSFAGSFLIDKSIQRCQVCISATVSLKTLCIWSRIFYYLRRRRAFECWRTRIAWRPDNSRRSARRLDLISSSMSALSWKRPSAGYRTASTYPITVLRSVRTSSRIWSGDTFPHSIPLRQLSSPHFQVSSSHILLNDIRYLFYVTHNRESYAPKQRIERRAIYEYGKDKNGDCHWKPHAAQHK